jgi:hypothetical protein
MDRKRRREGRLVDHYEAVSLANARDNSSPGHKEFIGDWLPRREGGELWLAADGEGNPAVEWSGR